MQNWIKTVIFLILAMGNMVLPVLAQEFPGEVVGRVYQVEGDLLRYVPAENDWVAVVRDAPFGTGDTLYAGARAMAELAVPNGSWIRAGNNTQLQFIDLASDLTETDVASGIVRFYNKGSRTVMRATSPYGYVLADPGTAFDFYVGENSVEVVAIRGDVSFVHEATGRRYDVSTGYDSILADANQVSPGDGTVDPDWDRWNEAREDFWSEKTRMRGRSVEYLPPDLRNDAYVLEENGRWESVPYEGSPRWFWRPVNVQAGWSPFTVGRWTDWYGDQTWIPAEPFGYVTHHYGNWVYVRNNWYWAPPVARVQIGIPLLNISFFWYPGRVSWIHSGAYVGWVPLAPRETYYSRRDWGGPHNTVVNNINITRININIRNYAYARQAIVVNQNNFYGVNNYRNVRVTNINKTTIINNYRAAPLVTPAVITNYDTNRQRYTYTDRQVDRKPHVSVVKRIRQNETLIQKDPGRRESAAVLQQQVKRAPEGRINRESRVAPPRIADRIVPVQEVKRPESEVRFQQKVIKKRGAGASETRPIQPTRPVRREAPIRTREPERVAPVSPVQPEKPAQIERSPQPVRPGQVRPERIQPTRPVQREEPVRTREPERVAPVTPVQPEKPVQIQRTPQPVRPERVRPERSQPARPVQREEPVRTREPERVAPVTPVQPEKPVQIQRTPQPVRPERVRPERSQPARPAQREAPVRTGEPVRIAPQKSVQPEKPVQIRRTPQPAQPAQVRPEGVQPAKPAPVKVKPARPDKRLKTNAELEAQKAKEELEKLKIEEDLEKRMNRR
ncbi:hypothetical protein FDZ73_01115 [bacterium]|nr:MAG: hypothetical protein FDZ73_01115 [bacterium]